MIKSRGLVRGRDWVMCTDWVIVRFALGVGPGVRIWLGDGPG